MPTHTRRAFLESTIGASAAMAVPAAPDGRAVTSDTTRTRRQAPSANRPPRIRFAAIGLNHGHINGLTQTVMAGGGELVWVHAAEPDLLAAFQKRFPQARAARSVQEVLDDASIHLVVSASIPDERAALAVDVMQHGKDILLDKPAVTTLDQLADVRRVQAATSRIVGVLYGRLESRSATRAGELVKAGAIGRVVQTLGLGPHRLDPPTRPAWTFERTRYGGILCDLASHQCDQFLYLTGSTQADVVAAQVGNVRYRQYPGLEDFGDAIVRGDGGTGYMRVDWLSPDGLTTWGDTRLTIMGTDGYIEIRSNTDIAGRPGGHHLFLVDQQQTRHIDCSQVVPPFSGRFVDDVLDRTETSMPQRAVFLATELALRAQDQARRLEGPAQG